MLLFSKIRSFFYWNEFSVLFCSLFYMMSLGFCCVQYLYVDVDCFHYLCVFCLCYFSRQFVSVNFNFSVWNTSPMWCNAPLRPAWWIRDAITLLQRRCLLETRKFMMFASCRSKNVASCDNFFWFWSVREKKWFVFLGEEKNGWRGISEE